MDVKPELKRTSTLVCALTLTEPLAGTVERTSVLSSHPVRPSHTKRLNKAQIRRGFRTLGAALLGE